MWVLSDDESPADSPTDDHDEPAATADIPLDRFYDALESHRRPLVTASELAREIGCSQAAAHEGLTRLANDRAVRSLDVGTDPVVWYPTDWKDTLDRERVVVFPGRREVVVDQPSQFTRAQLAGFARLRDVNREAGYLYELRAADIWQAPQDSFEALRTSMRQAFGQSSEPLESWVHDQWQRARKFRLQTHEDGYVLLAADSAELLGNVAEPKLAAGIVRARLSDTEAWVADDRLAELKRTLYEAGYPVQDQRALDEGATLSFDLELDLRPYQADWVERFTDAGSGVLVGPPGSGKTVAALGIMDAIGGECLILVPGRELAEQWRDLLLSKSSLTQADIGVYHGGEKRIRPVTIATYQSAGMDRHRILFDDRRWGLIVYDEVHHIPSPIHKRSTDLQAQHRLGLSVSGDTIVPIRTATGIERLPIERLAQRHLDAGEPMTDLRGVETLGVGPDGRVGWTPVRTVMRHGHEGQLYEITAADGESVRVTGDHSVMVFDARRSEITSKEAATLSETDLLLAPGRSRARAAGSAALAGSNASIAPREATGSGPVPTGRTRLDGQAVQTTRPAQLGALFDQAQGGGDPVTSPSQSLSRDGQRATTTARPVPIASIEPVAGEPLVYDLSTGVENFLGDGLFCHNSATPVREDEKEEQIYTLIGPPIGTDWEALFEAGYVTEPVVEIRLLPWSDEMAKNEYGSAAPRDRRQIAAMNPAKGAAIERLLGEHGAQQALIFVEYLEQGELLAERLSLPFISGETPHSRRRTLFDQFRAGDREALIVSRVGDEGIDLPNAEVAIAASGLGGSRRQGSQRAGRTMRPMGKAHMYVLATLGTKEEDFARQRTRHLAGRGVEVREAEMRLSGGEETEGSGSAD